MQMTPPEYSGFLSVNNNVLKIKILLSVFLEYIVRNYWK